jgi:nucleoside-diphosphate-sugar epimerase
MKSILITGARGFIGSHLVDKLKNKYKISCLDKNNSDLKVKKNFPNVDIVIHLAAYNSTKDFYNKPLDVVEDNLLPTLNLVRFYQKQKKKPLFIYTGTPEIFAGATDFFKYKIPTDEKVPMVIDDLENPRWSYATSKGLGEQIIMNSGLKYIIIRPNNIYGPRQKNHFVDEFMERAKKGNVELRGWKNTRSWLYIEDFCEATYKLMKSKKAVNQIINIGSDEEVRVLDIARLILGELGIKKAIIKKKAPKGSVKRRRPDIKKIKRLINWSPKTKLKDGIKKTIDFYK